MRFVKDQGVDYFIWDANHCELHNHSLVINYVDPRKARDNDFQP